MAWRRVACGGKAVERGADTKHAVAFHKAEPVIVEKQSRMLVPDVGGWERGAKPVAGSGTILTGIISQISRNGRSLLTLF